MKLITLKKEYDLVLKENITSYLDPDYIYLPITSETRLKINPTNYINKDDLLFGLEYSPISGKISRVKNGNTIDGACKLLVIQNDFKEKQAKKIGNRKNIRNLKKQEFLDLIEKYDQVIFNKFKNNFKKIVINSIEEQTYVANYIFINKNYSKEILDMIDAIGNIFDIKDIMIIVKDTDFSTISTYNNVLGMYPDFSLRLLPNKYLITQEENLEKILQLKDNYLYLNIEDLYYLYQYLKKNRYKEHKFITITGTAIDNPQVIMCKIGTSLEEIINNLININTEEYEVFANSLLTKDIIDINDFVVTNNLRAIFIMQKTNIPEERCIKCGKCSEICPVGIKVSKLINNRKCDVSNCINCGLCTYICPSNININKYLKGDNNE